MNIKEAEALSGVSRRNIRFYEQKGLLKPDRNQENDYREYSDGDIETLKLIRALRMLDMPLEQIREVVAGEQTLSDAVAAHKEKLKKRLRELETAVHFCDAFTAAETLNIDEVLCHMDEPENREKLSKRGERDYADAIISVAIPLFAGLIPSGAGFIFGSIALVCIFDMPLISWAMNLSALGLWAAFGCWLWRQGNWIRNGLLIHVIPFVLSVCSSMMLLLPESPISEIVSVCALLGYLPIYFTCFPLASALGLYSNVSLVPMALLILSFCLGGLYGNVRERRTVNALKDSPA